MPVYEFTIRFDAEDDEDAKMQVWGPPEGGGGAVASFDSIHDEDLTCDGKPVK